LPDPFVQCGRLCFEQWADDLDLALAGVEHGSAGQIQGGVFRMIAGDLLSSNLRICRLTAEDVAFRRRAASRIDWQRRTMSK
jgi:hypothetical protein